MFDCQSVEYSFDAQSVVKDNLASRTLCQRERGCNVNIMVTGPLFNCSSVEYSTNIQCSIVDEMECHHRQKSSLELCMDPSITDTDVMITAHAPRVNDACYVCMHMPCAHVDLFMTITHCCI